MDDLLWNIVQKCTRGRDNDRCAIVEAVHDLNARRDILERTPHIGVAFLLTDGQYAATASIGKCDIEMIVPETGLRKEQKVMVKDASGSSWIVTAEDDDNPHGTSNCCELFLS
jgi:hypothetical protein